MWITVYSPFTAIFHKTLFFAEIDTDPQSSDHMSPCQVHQFFRKNSIWAGPYTVNGQQGNLPTKNPKKKIEFNVILSRFFGEIFFFCSVNILSCAQSCMEEKMLKTDDRNCQPFRFQFRPFIQTLFCDACPYSYGIRRPDCHTKSTVKV